MLTRRFFPLLALLLAAPAATGSPQDPPNPSFGQGDKTYIGTYTEPANDEKGAKVGEKEVKVSYTMMYQLTDRGFKPIQTIECGNFCRGGKHNGHKECDKSCDNPCSSIHRIVMVGEVYWDDAAIDKIEKAAYGLVVKAQHSWLPDFSTQTNNLYRNLNSMADKASVDFTAPHVEAAMSKPCTVATAVYGKRVKTVTLSVVLTQDITTTISGKSTKTTTVRDPISADVGTMYVPEKEPQVSDPIVACGCKEKPEPPRTGMAPGRTPTYAGLGTSPLPGTAGFYTAGGIGLGYRPLKTWNRFTGIDMNETEVKITNNLMEPLEYRIAPGSIFMPSDCCDDGPSQYEVAVLAAMIMVPAARMEGPPENQCGPPVLIPGTATLKVRSLCMNMNRKEPTKNTRFRLARCNNDGLLELAAMTAAARSHTVRDQIRIWILMDHATTAMLLKRLDPGPSAGQYIGALHDVENVGHVNTSGPEFRPCFEARLALDWGTNPVDLAWFLQRLAQLAPDDLVREVSQNAKKVVDEEGDTPRASAIRHWAALGAELCGSTNPGFRRAGLGFLLSAVPEKQRAAVAAQGALRTMRRCLASKDADEVGLALDVAAAYEAKPLAGLIAEIAASGPASLRAKAAEVGKKLE